MLGLGPTRRFFRVETFDNARARCSASITRNPTDFIIIACDVRTAAAAYSAGDGADIVGITKAAIVSREIGAIDRVASVERSAMDAQPAPTCDEDNEVRLRPNEWHGLGGGNSGNYKRKKEKKLFHLLILVFICPEGEPHRFDKSQSRSRSILGCTMKIPTVLAKTALASGLN